MFKISTKGDYGLLLMSGIAAKMQQGKRFVSLKEISQEKKLSLPYLSQIILPLKRAGLVESKEGRDGGYALTKPAREISMMEILEILEGPIEPVRCCSGKSKQCGSEAYCGVKGSFKDAQAMLTQFLRTKTLADTLNVPQSAAPITPRA